MVAAWVGLAPGGCGPAKRLLYDPQTPLPPIPKEFEDREWATVLRENVKDGLVDYEHLSAHAAPLDRFLEIVAAAGPVSTPELFPSPESRTAYYLNACNAAYLKAALVAGLPPTLHDLGAGEPERVYRLRADRREQGLADLAAAARAERPWDARIELGLCDAALGSPPLFAEPFRGDRLEDQFRRVAREALACPRVVTIDHEHRQLKLAAAIREHEATFIQFYERETASPGGTILASLLHLADGPRREWLNTAVGYAVSGIPFDRRLNHWQRASAGAQDGR